MVSLKYIDSDFKTFCRISDGYIRTLQEIFDMRIMELEIVDIYKDAEMYDECFKHLEYVFYLDRLFESLISEESEH